MSKDNNKNKGKGKMEEWNPEATPFTSGDISKSEVKLTEEEEFAKFIEDAYSPEASSTGRLDKSKWLALPEDWKYDVVPAGDVGTERATKRFSMKDLAAVYVLNKARAPEEESAIKFGMLRMEAVKNGWLATQKEVVRVPRPPNAMTEFLTDIATVKDDFGTIRTTSFVVPLAAEYVFRTVGHHYLTSDSAMFVNKYDQVFRASLVPEVTKFLPAHILYHAALHWISPGRVMQVVRAQSETMNIPDAIKTRMNSAPSRIIFANEIYQLY
ncbi:hypothetical protein G6F37_013070 [Rhizopus arrhizus]|nr:hypothetical protein G6F38_012295 [Rhizopus arrhizus]KAG1139943.1 hypothetical protein G6F37_013070 [Rhizopus arrhizus]